MSARATPACRTRDNIRSILSSSTADSAGTVRELANLGATSEQTIVSRVCDDCDNVFRTRNIVSRHDDRFSRFQDKWNRDGVSRAYRPVHPPPANAFPVHTVPVAPTSQGTARQETRTGPRCSVHVRERTRGIAWKTNTRVEKKEARRWGAMEFRPYRSDVHDNKHPKVFVGCMHSHVFARWLQDEIFQLKLRDCSRRGVEYT